MAAIRLARASFLHLSMGGRLLPASAELFSSDELLRLRQAAPDRLYLIVKFKALHRLHLQ